MLGVQNILGIIVSIISKNNFSGLIVPIVLKISYAQASLTDCLTTRDVYVGCLGFGSMYCSNFAMKLVNYPFVILAKSAKIMPVMIVGSIRGTY